MKVKKEFSNSLKIEKKEIKKPRIPTRKHKLIKDGVIIGDIKHKIGDSVDLTEEGRTYFKQQKYIK
jgi:hypothetical protein